MQQITLKGLAFICRREALVTVPYQDGKHLSIGFGSNGPHVKPGMEVTLEEALELLRFDVADIERRLNRSLTIELHPWRFDALGSAAYNLGVTGIKGVIQLVNARKFTAAMDELEKRHKIKAGADFVVSEGLLKRRRKERIMFEKGEYGELSPIPTWRGNPHKTPMTQTAFPGI